jgi:hypothetical protein
MMLSPASLLLLIASCQRSSPPLVVVDEATMYCKRGAGAEVLLDGERVHPGDRLRPCARGPHSRATLMGQDSSGRTVVHGTWQLVPGELRCAPFALELDATPGPELFWIVATRSREVPVLLSPPAGVVSWRFPKS